MWMEVPLPDDANASLPGFFLAYSTSSCTDFTGTWGFTTRMLGTLAPSATGAKSRVRSNETFLYSVWLMALVTATNSNV
ncbi:hypothetical protein D3C85_1556380 [compost metagenome]